MTDSDATMERLETQIGWYDRKSITRQRVFQRIKVVQIIAAAVIPFLAALSVKEASSSLFPKVVFDLFPVRLDASRYFSVDPVISVCRCLPRSNS